MILIGQYDSPFVRRAVSRRALSGAGGAQRGLRGVAGVFRNRAAADSADRVIGLTSPRKRGEGKKAK
jgi:hypothetical protein